MSIEVDLDLETTGIILLKGEATSILTCIRLDETLMNIVIVERRKWCCFCCQKRVRNTPHGSPRITPCGFNTTAYVCRSYGETYENPLCCASLNSMHEECHIRQESSFYILCIYEDNVTRTGK